jgi:hypothetical protein
MDSGEMLRGWVRQLLVRRRRFGASAVRTRRPRWKTALRRTQQGASTGRQQSPSEAVVEVEVDGWLVTVTLDLRGQLFVAPVT